MFVIEQMFKVVSLLDVTVLGDVSLGHQSFCLSINRIVPVLFYSSQTFSYTFRAVSDQAEGEIVFSLYFV